MSFGVQVDERNVLVGIWEEEQQPSDTAFRPATPQYEVPFREFYEPEETESVSEELPT